MGEPIDELGLRRLILAAGGMFASQEAFVPLPRQIDPPTRTPPAKLDDRACPLEPGYGVWDE